MFPKLFRPTISFLVAFNNHRPISFQTTAVKVKNGSSIRNGTGSFFDAHVFPGGYLDPSDTSVKWEMIYGLQDKNQESNSLEGQKLHSLAHKICAIRETFEESGLLISKPIPTWSEEESKFWREKIHSNVQNFFLMCKNYDTNPAVHDLYFFSNWVTPVTEKKRYDTIFYLTALPDVIHETKNDESALERIVHNHIGVDTKETIQLDWFTPGEAIEAYQKDQIHLFPPQWYILNELTSYKKLQDLLLSTCTNSRKVIPMIPEFVRDKETNKLFGALPGDMEHSTTTSEDKATKPNLRHRFYFELEKKKIKNISLEKKL
ncbi:hypothetical protein G9A89_003217 [Geosiphon pyriformis]|nr:hypothetical protein G9A89_003217 [Geosiphon pyriformis]